MMNNHVLLHLILQINQNKFLQKNIVFHSLSIFRPHPLLFSNMINEGFWTLDDKENYIQKLKENQPANRKPFPILSANDHLSYFYDSQQSFVIARRKAPWQSHSKQ